MFVIKRDGSEQVFDQNKIKVAITKANNSVKEDSRIKESTINTIVNAIVKKCEELNRAVGIEEIQDMVENELIDRRAKSVAKEYVVYRYEHKLIRDQYKDLMKKVADKIFARDVKQQNANVDERSFGGRIGEASDVLMREFALNYIMSPTAKFNHENNRIYTHDLNAYAVGMHNCLSIPYDKLLLNGFNTRQVDIRGARSLNSACQLVAVIAQLQSLQQFGGVSATHIDWTLVPFVRMSFFKHYKDGLKFLLGYTDREVNALILSCGITEASPMLDYLNVCSPDTMKVYDYAMCMTEKECHQGIEALYHNLNSLQSRSGCQLPFTSINYGTCTLDEGRMVIKHILEVSIEGLGKKKRTSIFPCGIFQCKQGINRKPGDPNYDLFRLALKSTALRLYPNYANCDWSGNSGYKDGDPCQLFSTMGCVDGRSIIDYKIDNVRYVESISRAWNRLLDTFGSEVQPDGINEYINTPGVCIYDTKLNSYVKQYRMIRNIQDKWCNITFTGGRFIDVTDDHPFETETRGVVLARDLTFGDVIRRDVSNTYTPSEFKFNPNAWFDGLVLCDASIAGSLTISLGLDEMDIVKTACNVIGQKNHEYLIREWHRGVKGNYIDLYAKRSSDLCSEYNQRFEGNAKAERHIPQDIFNASREDKLSFLGGMIDADGYINNSGNVIRVQLGSTNMELALGQMLLVKDLGLNAVIYKNKYSSYKSELRYRVEFNAVPELNDYIVCAKKKSHFDPNHKFTNACLLNDSECVVSNIFYYESEKYSYDVTTESEHFTVNGIYSHNCRTANGWDVNGLGQQKDGRGNICPVTIILPTLAMEAEGDVDRFMTILNDTIHQAKDQLIERFEWICSQSPESAKFMYENGTMEGYIPEEGIRSALKHGTLAIGQLGLAECLEILVGCNHTHPKGMELAKRIEQMYKDLCAKFKEEYKLNFGVYLTPAENLAYTAMKKFKARYGVIPKVSDREYFTNSMHVPVWEKMNPFEKIDIESQLTGYSSAGCITYCELDGSCKHNVDAIEELVNYALDHDIPYFAINVPNDQCLDCGYIEEINDTCPECGSKNIMRLRRVTGYLTSDYKTAFNPGKIAEVEDRVKHK